MIDQLDLSSNAGQDIYRNMRKTPSHNIMPKMLVTTFKCTGS